MIKTKDLEQFINGVCNRTFPVETEKEWMLEYRQEIVVRLRAYDTLKEGIEKLIAKLCPESIGIDK